MGTVELNYVIDRMHDIMIATNDQKEHEILVFLDELLHNAAINSCKKWREESCS
jgi:hypothetical protein